MNLLPAAARRCGWAGRAWRGSAPRTRVCRVAEDGGCVFELAERTGAERLWHLRAGDEPIAVRAPEGVEAPPRGARVEVTVPEGRVRRFDAATGRAVAA